VSAAFPTITAVGAGTIQASAVASTAVPVVPSASTLARDLVVVVCYVQGADIVTTPPVDAGGGWLVVDAGYDSVNAFGVFIAVCLAPRAGASGWAGLTIPSASARTAQTYTYRIGSGFSFDVGAARGSQGWFNASASATALGQPAILQPYAQVIDLCGGGYNNAGTTTTVGNVTGFTERFDTGQVSPPHGVALRERSVSNAIQNASGTAALAVAKTMRGGVRCMVPIVADTANGRAHRGQFRRVA